jgi:hypothetical protein
VSFLPDGGQEGRLAGEDDDQTRAPELRTGIQGEGGVCGGDGRTDAGGAGAAF